MVWNSVAGWYQVEPEMPHYVVGSNGGLLHESTVKALLHERNAGCLTWPQTGYKWHLFKSISGSYNRIIKKIAYNLLFFMLACGSGIKQHKNHPT